MYVLTLPRFMALCFFSGLLLATGDLHPKDRGNQYALQARVAVMGDVIYYDLSNMSAAVAAPHGPLSFREGLADVIVDLRNDQGKSLVVKQMPTQPTKAEFDRLQNPRLLAPSHSVGLIFSQSDLRNMYHVRPGCYSLKLSYSYTSALGSTYSKPTHPQKICFQ